jgi:DHA2 family multidrug resistance protein
MACIFVPLTTVTMDPVPKEEMGNATSLFNLMRNLGGSFGIAFVTAALTRRTQFHLNRLSTDITASNPLAQQALAAAKARFMQLGADAVTATQRAYAAIYGMVQQQASLLSFVEIFWLLAVVFLVMTPIIWIMRKPRGGAPTMAH